MITKILRLFRNKRNPGKSLKASGVLKDSEDVRDFVQATIDAAAFPKSFSLRQYVPPIKNQGGIGSCASHALATAVEMLLKINKPSGYIELSELYHYYIVRSVEYMNTLPQDSGQYIREGCKVLQQKGITPETLCKYDVSKFNVEPNFMAKSFARFWKIKNYSRCVTVDQVKAALLEKKPVVFGFKYYKSHQESTGEINAPTGNDYQIGGHAVLAIGFNDDLGIIEFANSWSLLWGDRGFGTIKYVVFDQLLLDAWALEALQ